MTLIKNMEDLKKQINIACTKAIEDTANTVMKNLHDCIGEQYYNDPEFCPNIYKRTKTFLNAVSYQLLSSNTAQIYVDIDGMHYENNFSPWQVVRWAAESKHGADYYQTTTIDFWTTFIGWCNDNLINIFKENLCKYGLNVR